MTRAGRRVRFHTDCAGRSPAQTLNCSGCLRNDQRRGRRLGLGRRPVALEQARDQRQVGGVERPRPRDSAGPSELRGSLPRLPGAPRSIARSTSAPLPGRRPSPPSAAFPRASSSSPRRAAGRERRRRRVLVDDAACRRLECRRDRPGGLRDVIVNQAGEAFGRVTRDQRLEEKKELVHWRSVSPSIVGNRMATSCSCWRLTTAAGCSRADVR